MNAKHNMSLPACLPFCIICLPLVVVLSTGHWGVQSITGKPGGIWNHLPHVCVPSQPLQSASQLMHQLMLL
jgi:hypothetical protein